MNLDARPRAGLCGCISHASSLVTIARDYLELIERLL